MMDIAEFKERLIVSANRHRESESYELSWVRQRECSPRRPIFWRMVIRVLRKFLIKVFSTSLSVCEKIATATSFSLIAVIVLIFPTVDDTPLKIELPRGEVSRGPPKGFVPLPDAEIGGCARNDSLIVPAI
ncbi:hypothetical protein [Microcoleus sp. herbarium12]|uniref:hypothetical protein n=1 Tax=Microcoleus sp. herbarium12 TaxID=3055437 RepID=UPI002FCF8F0B